MYEKYTKIIFILLAASITFYFCKAILKPNQFVPEYLNARYTDTDYLSIAEKAEQQKPFLKDEQINADIMFAMMSKSNLNQLMFLPEFISM